MLLPSLLLLLMQFMLLTPVTAAEVLRPAAQEFHFRDGGMAIFYTLNLSGGYTPVALHDAGLPTSVNAADTPEQWLFVIAGAGCQSMGPLLPDYFTGLEGERFPIRVLILHKRHISAAADGQHCSDAFIEADHPSQWLADQREFIEHQLALSSPQGRARLPQVVLMGISEGAEPASLLALQLPVSHLVLLSHSGLAPLDLYQQLAERYPHMREGWRELSSALAHWSPDRQSDPQHKSQNGPQNGPQQRIHGRSWRYWSEAATLQPSPALLAFRRPVLVGVGDADPLVPAQALAALQKQFADAGSAYLTLRRFPDADHGLDSKYRHYLPDFMHQIGLWLSETP